MEQTVQGKVMWKTQLARALTAGQAQSRGTQPPRPRLVKAQTECAWCSVSDAGKAEPSMRKSGILKRGTLQCCVLQQLRSWNDFCS